MTDLAEPPAPLDATADAGASRDESRDERWDERRLCPDGACVGVLDDDGRCPVCGRVDQAAPRPAVRRAEPRDATGDAVAAPAPTPAVEERVAGDGGTADDWSSRQLCDDGACIGVIVDGRCTTCGKAPAP